MKNLFSVIKNHKLISGLLLVATLGGAIYAFLRFQSAEAEASYVLGKAERGAVVLSVSGSGQISASNQVDLSAKTSGDLVYLNAQVGRAVRAGELIGQIDAGNAAFDLENARLSYQDLVNVDDEEVRDAEEAATKAAADLEDAYQDAWTKLTSAVTDMSDVVSGVDGLLDGYLNIASRYDLGKSEKEIAARAEAAYYSANRSLKDFLKIYRTLSESTTDDQIEMMLASANQTAVQVDQMAKYARDAVIRLRQNDDQSTTADEAYEEANSLLTKADGVVTATLSSSNSIASKKSSLETAQSKLQDIQDGPDPLDLRKEELSLRQKQDTYNEYFIRAPFDGIIASVAAQKGDSLSSGAKVATLVTKQKVAEISLNEVDAAKVKVGQEVELSFDAVPDLTLPGKVAEMDLVGTVSQGVVSYNVKIGFDNDDERIKAGMTANAVIVTEQRTNVVTVSAGAIKTRGKKTFVDVLDPATQGLKPVEIEVGLLGDEAAEVVSGLKEGEAYVLRTNSSASQSAARTPGLMSGSRAAGGVGAVRITR